MPAAVTWSVVIRVESKYDLTQTQLERDSPMPLSSPTIPAAGSLHERVRGVIDLIRPAVQADGGDLELVNVTDAGVVQIRFHGACHGCPSSTMTLKAGIENLLKRMVPDVIEVVAEAA